MQACGFELRFEELAAASAPAPDAASACGSERASEAAAASEAFAVLPVDADLGPLRQALQLLSQSAPPGMRTHPQTTVAAGASIPSCDFAAVSMTAASL